MGASTQAVRARGGVTIVDEIYLGLSYDDAFGHSALALGRRRHLDQQLLQVLQHDGWRLGWLVLPGAGGAGGAAGAEPLHLRVARMAQHAALACFEPESIAEYERRRAEFRRAARLRRAGARRAGPGRAGAPDGAFYAWADCSRALLPDSWDFCFDMMRRAHVALTPGRDFGRARPSASCACPVFSTNPPGVAAGDLPSIGRIARYDLKYRIGEGGLGTVYVAPTTRCWRGRSRSRRVRVAVPAAEREQVVRARSS
jgi:hypothetical protein